ncbi:TPA: PagK family vesicle-borne virulence factor, partial [Salmonella enterica subsp. diarizonae serovar 50:k:z35]
IRIMIRYLTGDIMKYVKNIFLILVFALSATAFSTSAMAASETKSPPKSDDLPQPNLPEMPKWCKKLLESGGLLPSDFYKLCWGR